MLSQPSKTPTPHRCCRASPEGGNELGELLISNTYRITKKESRDEATNIELWHRLGLPQRTSRRSNIKTANCGAQLMLHGGYRVPPALLSPRATDR